MKKSSIQSLKDSGYKFVKYLRKGVAIFSDNDKWEIFFANKGHGSWGISYNNTDWEFASSRIL